MPMLVNREELAVFLERSPRTVATLLRQGLPVVERGDRSRPWVFDLVAVKRWLLGQAGASEDAGDDAGSARARLEAARAEIAELELAEKRGELVEVEFVAALDADRIARAKAVLEQVPRVLALQLVGESSPRELERKIREHIEAALTELAKADQADAEDGSTAAA